MSYIKPYDIHLGNCLEVLKGIPDNSVDSIVTDPPYGLAFMGKKWDYDVPEQAIWQECLRVLKPGAQLKMNLAAFVTVHTVVMLQALIPMAMLAVLPGSSTALKRAAKIATKVWMVLRGKPPLTRRDVKREA